MSDVNKQLLEAVKEFFDAEQSEGREKFGHFYKPATREHQQRERIARAKLHEAIAAAEQATAEPVARDVLMAFGIEIADKAHAAGAIGDTFMDEEVAAIVDRYATKPPAVAVPEINLSDIRCECCGYMTYHREHMGCIRAAQKGGA